MWSIVALYAEFGHGGSISSSNQLLQAFAFHRPISFQLLSPQIEISTQSYRIAALFWGSKKSVKHQPLDSSLGDFTLSESTTEGVKENQAIGKKVSISVVSSILEVSALDWDSCYLDATGPGKFNPFLTHAFLSSLEETGCAVKETGWMPSHVVTKDESENILSSTLNFIMQFLYYGSQSLLFTHFVGLLVSYLF